MFRSYFVSEKEEGRKSWKKGEGSEKDRILGISREHIFCTKKGEMQWKEREKGRRGVRRAN